MTYKGLLPIGSVVKLRNVEEQSVMITGYCVRKAEEREKLFDYCGCFHPIGMMSSDQTLMFNHDQIEMVKSVGYINEESYVVIPKMEEILAQLRADGGTV